jgi:hypothetical protein
VYVQSHVESLLFSGEGVTNASLTQSIEKDLGNHAKSDPEGLYSRVPEFFSNILGLFLDGRNRHAVLASSTVMVAQYTSPRLHFSHCCTDSHKAVFRHQRLCLPHDHRVSAAEQGTKSRPNTRVSGAAQ